MVAPPSLSRSAKNAGLGLHVKSHCNNSHILDGTSKTVVFTWNPHRELKGADLIRMSRDHLTVNEILGRLWSMGIRNVLVEGGKQVIH